MFITVSTKAHQPPPNGSGPQNQTQFILRSTLVLSFFPRLGLSIDLFYSRYLMLYTTLISSESQLSATEMSLNFY